MFFAFSFSCQIMPVKGDTLSYWHVFLNDSIIAQFNADSIPRIIKFDSAYVESINTLHIKYARDTWCDCTLCVYVPGIKYVSGTNDVLCTEMSEDMVTVIGIPTRQLIRHGSKPIVVSLFSYLNNGLVSMDNAVVFSEELFEVIIE